MTIAYRREEMGGMITHIILPQEKPDRYRLAVILCHGYGAPGDDLVDLAGHVCQTLPEAADDVVFLFPEAPLSLEDQGMPGARAWWHLDLDRMLRFSTPELAAMFRTKTPDGLPAARAKLAALVDEVKAEYGLTTSQIVLGGFSQGGMMAIDSALHLAEAPGAVVIFSGTLINEQEWRPKAKDRGPLRVLQSHGRQDQILPYTEALKLKELLEAGGAQLDFIDFVGGHQIPQRPLERMTAIIDELRETSP